MGLGGIGESLTGCCCSSRADCDALGVLSPVETSQISTRKGAGDILLDRSSTFDGEGVSIEDLLEEAFVAAGDGEVP